jgi:hypothetical protein
MWTRPDGVLSSVLSRDIPDPAGTGRLEKSPAGIAARAFFLSCNRSSEWYEPNSSRHHRQRSGWLARLESHFMATPCQLQFFRRVHLGRSAPINGYGDPAMLIYRSRTPLPGLLVWCSLSSSGSPAFDLLTVPSRASRTGRTLLGTPLSALARMSSVQRIAKRSDCSQEGTTEYLWTFSVSLISSERQAQAGP